jgi:hypothetical protein
MLRYLFPLLLIASSSFGQTFQPNFLGADFIRYKGALLKLKDDNYLALMHLFYSDLKYCQELKDSNVIYPSDKYKFMTVSDSLKGRIFRVDNIVDKEGNTLTTNSKQIDPILVLKDQANGQIIYLKYNKEDEYEFPFVTSKIELNKELLCAKIERSVDKFTGEVTFNSPIGTGWETSAMTIYKTIKGSIITNSLYLRTYGSTVNVNSTGVIILFDDGTKINKPSVKIDVDVEGSRFIYGAYFALTESDLKTLSNKRVDRFRLYIYDEVVNPKKAEEFTHFVSCIIDKRK